MNHTLSEVLTEEERSALLDSSITPVSRPVGVPGLHARWEIKALLIELAVIAIGLVSVVIYNWLFKASISPVLGVIVGAVNGSLVAWCVTRADQLALGSKNPSARKDTRS
ncbi:hypothetical protein AAKU67_002386 [Oxalobacteraceae bacterium GrIS 2.11]